MTEPPDRGGTTTGISDARDISVGTTAANDGPTASLGHVTMASSDDPTASLDRVTTASNDGPPALQDQARVNMIAMLDNQTALISMNTGSSQAVPAMLRLNTTATNPSAPNPNEANTASRDTSVENTASVPAPRVWADMEDSPEESASAADAAA